MKKRKRAPHIRVDLPPLDELGAWPDQPIAWGGSATSPERSDIIAQMQAVRARPRNVTASDLVPEHVRTAYAEFWREEHLELKREEALTRAHRWRAIWRRLIDRVAGRPVISEPFEPQPLYTFRG